MDCDLASDLSKQVALLLPPLPEYTCLTIASSNNPSFVLASNDIEGEERIVLPSNDIQGEEPREEILPLPEDPSSIVLPNNDIQEEELSNSRAGVCGRYYPTSKFIAAIIIILLSQLYTSA